MTSASISPSSPHAIPKIVAPIGRTARLSAFPLRASSEAAEERRWLFMLGIPFVASASFYAATIGTGTLLLLAPALILGPALLIMTFIYLALTSDTNRSDQRLRSRASGAATRR